MNDVEENRKHFNLYYIYEKEKQLHPMPPERVKELLEKLRKILENQTTKEN